MREKLPVWVLGSALGVLVVGCVSPGNELENVAKDWCLTIRASQVLPVYPLSEDVRPGDVFVVSTTAKEQARIYEEKGFLSLDQRVTRLHGLPYDEYYANAFTGLPQAIPVTDESEEAPEVEVAPVEHALPRAAFPSYNFEVTKSGGLKIALPLQGVASGLGLMGASRAIGTVTIRDAYTYGVASDSLIELFYRWYLSDKEIRSMLRKVANQIEEDVYLRIVTRVYLTGGVTVSMTNLDSSGAGADVGAAPQVALIDLATEDPEAAKAAANAYQKVLGALSGKLSSVEAGGGFRFVQASSRAVTLDEDFDRPLVIGYRGFDVRVSKNGSLSAPIPSFATLSGEGLASSSETAAESRAADETEAEVAAAFEAPVWDPTTERLDIWIDEDGKNYDLLQDWINRQIDAEDRAGPLPSLPDFIYLPEYAEMRVRAIQELVEV